MRQLLTEGVTLSLGGGVARRSDGRLLDRRSAARATVPHTRSMRGLSAQPDARVLLFALALSVHTGVMFGLGAGMGNVSRQRGRYR